VLDYLHQEPSYAEYAYTHGLIPLQAKLHFDWQWTQCLETIQQSGLPLTRNSFNQCHMMSSVLLAAGKPNEYNTATFIGYDVIIKPVSPYCIACGFGWVSDPHPHTPPNPSPTLTSSLMM
jgi:hypothetical protein